MRVPNHAAKVTALKTPVGRLIAMRRGSKLTLDWILPGEPLPKERAVDADACKILAAVERSLDGDDRGLAAIPTAVGTPFQRSVWNCCRTSPSGQTRTYGWIAARLGRSNACCRAIGQALRRNPLSVVVPCHRVVSASGLGGYSGETSGPMARVKSWLIAREKSTQTAD